MFLITIEEINSEFEYTHHMLLPIVDGSSDKELIEDFYGEGSVTGEDRKRFYWVWGDVLARVKSTQSLTDDEAATLIKFI